MDLPHTFHAFHGAQMIRMQELDKSQLIWAALSDSNVKICMAGVTCALMVGTLRGPGQENEGVRETPTCLSKTKMG